MSTEWPQTLIEHREQNELQYSVRSVFSALQTRIGIAHILVADLPWDSSTDTDSLPTSWPVDNVLRLAQTPRWLDFEAIGCSPKQYNGTDRPILQLVTHSDIFHLPTDTTWNIVIEQQWLRKALPSFNSKAIESRLGWIPGLVRNLICC